jgi:hypothetical protein
MNLTGEELVNLVNYYRLIQEELEGTLEDQDSLTDAQEAAADVIDRIVEANEFWTQSLNDVNSELERQENNLSRIIQLQSSLASDLFAVTTYGMTRQELFGIARGEFQSARETWNQAWYGGGTTAERISALQTLESSIMNMRQAGLDYIQEASQEALDAENKKHNAIMSGLQEEYDKASDVYRKKVSLLDKEQKKLSQYILERATFGETIDSMMRSMTLSVMSPVDRFNYLRNIITGSMSVLSGLSGEDKLSAIEQLMEDWKSLQKLALQIYGEGSDEAIAVTKEVVEGLGSVKQSGLDYYDKTIALQKDTINLVQAQVDMAKGDMESVWSEMQEEILRHNKAIEDIQEETKNQIRNLNATISSMLEKIGDTYEFLYNQITEDISEAKKQRTMIEFGFKYGWPIDMSIEQMIQSIYEFFRMSKDELREWAQKKDVPFDEFREDIIKLSELLGLSVPETFQVGGRVIKSGLARVEAGELIQPVTGARPLDLNNASEEVKVYVLPMFYRNVNQETIDRYVKEDVIPVITRESGLRGKKIIFDSGIKNKYRGVA